MTKLKIQVVTKLKNLNCDKTQLVKLWQLKTPNCEKKIISNIQATFLGILELWVAEKK